MIVVFTTYPSLDASRRLRIDPVVEELTRRGCQVEVHCLITDWMFRHKNGTPIHRGVIGLALLFNLVVRIGRVCNLSSDATVLIHREAFPFFTPWAERLLRRRARKLVVDVDDAIYVQPTHGRDWRNGWRDSERFAEVLAMADLVLAGSPHMANYAEHAGAAVTALALTCPLASTAPQGVERSASPRVLWTGGQSTLGSLESVLDDVCRALVQIADAKLVVLGGQNVSTLAGNPNIIAKPWSQAEESLELSRCWFGIMPIPDSPWERGKSGYKAILYLSAGLPALASPVGFNIWLADQINSVRLVADGEWEKEIVDQIHRGPKDVMDDADLSWLSRNIEARANAKHLADRLLNL